ncbi:MAG: hypothetical protein ABFE13_11370 [Phycisphaerales bacterium]
MAGKPDFGAALRVLGSDLKDIAQHKREEQLMKLVREQREADMEAERQHQEKMQRATLDQQAALAEEARAQREFERNQDFMRNSIPAPNRLFPNLRIPLGAYNAMKPDVLTKWQEGQLAVDRERLDLERQRAAQATSTPKVPDMAGIGSAVENRDPALATALGYSGLLAALKDEAVRSAGTGLQPEQAAMQAWQGVPNDPGLVGEIMGALPPGLTSGGIIPAQPKVVKSFARDIPERPAQYLEAIIAASADVQQKLQAIGKKTKTISDDKLEAIIARAAARWKLDADGQKAMRDQIYLGRAAENLPGVGGAPVETAAQKRARELASGGGA